MILLLPILIVFIIYFLFFKTTFSFLLKSVFSITLIISSDLILRIMIKSGNDSETIMVTNLFFWIDVIILSMLALVYILKKDKRLKNIITLILSLGVLLFYINHFYNFLMTTKQYNCENVISSKNKKVFIKNLTFDKKKIKIENDSVVIKNGWVEDEIKVINNGFKNKTKKTDSIYWIIELDSNFEQDQNYNIKVYYKFNSSDYVGASPINKIISFRTNKNQPNLKVFFINPKTWKTEDSIQLSR